MAIDWQFYAFMIAQIIALVSAYWGLKRDNQSQALKSEASYQKLSALLDASHAKLSSELTLSTLTERTERSAGQTGVKNDLMKLISAVDTAVKDLSNRVTKLEGGQDEWTKSLRQRTHELADHLQTLVLKVDRLERPAKHGVKEHEA